MQLGSSAWTGWGAALAGAAVLATALWLTLSPPASGPAAGGSAPTPTRSASAAALAPGQAVVAGASLTSMREGTIASIEGDSVTVAVPRAAAIVVPRGHVVGVAAKPTAATPGDALLCPIGPRLWQGCRVDSVSGETIAVTDLAGRSATLALAATLAPPPELTHEIGEQVLIQARLRRFDAELAQAGSPRKPRGWQPRPGEQVVAPVAGAGWFVGVVEHIDGDRVRLRWPHIPSPPGEPDELTVAQIAPLPQAPLRADVGQYCLVRPSEGSRWDPWRIVSEHEGRYGVVNRAGFNQFVAAADVLPLDGSAARPEALEASDADVASPPEVVDAMLALAGVGENDLLYDLGCGDGRILIAAADKYGARAVGYDIDPRRVAEARRNVARAGLDDRVRVVQGDIFDVDLSEATVVALFLGPDLNARLLPQLRRLPSHARVVSHFYPIPGLPPDQTVEVVVGEAPPNAALPELHPSQLIAPPAAYRAPVHLWKMPLAAPER